MNALLRAAVVATLVAALFDVAVAVESEAKPAAKAVATDDAAQVAKPTGTGIAAMEKAAKHNKYLFALFRKEDNDQVASMRQELAAAMKQVADRADTVEVDVSAAAERDIVDRFDLDYAPMPLLLAIAPNGAVTGGFPGRVQTQRLTDVFVSPCTARCLKGFQNRKLVFVCVKNARTTSDKEAMRGVRAFKRDERFTQDTEIIVVDPADKAESQLLFDLEIDPKTEEAVTVFFAPPGRCIGQFRGATNLDDLVATLAAAMSGCGTCGPGGCGPGGCGPGGCGP